MIVGRSCRYSRSSNCSFIFGGNKEHAESGEPIPRATLPAYLAIQPVGCSYKSCCLLSEDYRFFRSGSAVFPIQKTTFGDYFWRLPKNGFPAPASVYIFFEKNIVKKISALRAASSIKKSIEEA